MNSTLKRALLWLLPAVGAVALAGYIYFALPHERTVTSLGMLVLKFAPFVLAGIAVAFFPRLESRLWQLVLPFLTFLPFFGFLVPRQLYFIQLGIEEAYAMPPGADRAALDATFASFYTVTAILVPFFILSVAFAYRLGGGTSGTTLKLAGSGILLMLSGIEDIMFFVVNGLWPMPEVIHWASHMTVRLGRAATRTEFFLLCAAHFTLILLLLALPLDRWLSALSADSPRSPAGTHPLPASEEGATPQRGAEAPR